MLNNIFWLQPLLGGILIGIASCLLLTSIGRIAGISGIITATITPNKNNYLINNAWRWCFLIGLIIGGFITTQLINNIDVNIHNNNSSIWVMITAGLLVGFGSVLGSGCTSGHGVCGLGRRSKRSLIATLTFMLTGFITVFIINVLTGQAML